MKSLSFLTAGICLFAGLSQASAQTLSEFRLDMPGADTEEFVELAGAVGASLDGITFVILGDSGSTNIGGEVETAVDLTGHVINGNGFFVLAKSTFTLGVADLTDDGMSFENGDNVTYMLISGFTGAVSDDLDTNDDGVLDALTGTIIDSLSILEEVGGGDLVYGSQSIGPDGTFVPATGWICSGTWVIGDYDHLAGTNTAGADNLCAPPGDDCANAVGAGLGVNAFDTTGNTTSMTAGPCVSATIYNDHFFTFAPPLDGDYRFETCGSATGYDTKIAVYENSCAGACLNYNDDACPGFLSAVTVALSAGDLVVIQVGGYGSGDSGPGELTITELAAPPGNDDCANAEVAALGATTFDTDLASTSGLAEPSCSTSAIHNDVFYTYTAGSDLDVSFATCGANFDTKIRVYDVDCAGACLGYNDDACATSIGNNYASELILSMTLGQTVVIQTGGWGSSDRGQGDLTISEIIPGNDCEGALAAALGVTSFDTTINTTSGQGDTSCFSGAMHNDIWFTYTAASDGDHSFATCGSGYDTRIKLFDGDCAGACLAYNDDACATSVGNNFASLAQVPLTTGQTVMVQISGWGAGDNGPGDLTVTELGGPPPNDACAGATVITGNTAFDNAAATSSGEATCFTVNKDLWYSFTATREGAHTFDTCSASGDSKIAVFDGACGSLVCLMANDDFCGLQSAVNPTLAIGQTVLIQVGAYGSSGVVAGDLHVHEPSLCDATGVEDAISVASANHACASAVALPNGVYPGLVVCKDRPDFFTFAVADGATVDLEIQFPTATADQDMFLYDAAACLDDQNSGCAGSLACGYSASDNEVISWTNTTGADMVCNLRVNIWPNDAGEIGNYQLSISGSLDGGTSSFCSPAVANSTGASVSLGASSTTGGGTWVNAMGGPDAEFGYMLISATNNDPGVSVADGMLCLTGNIGRYNSVAGVVYPDRDSTGQFVASGTGGNSVFYTSNDNGPLPGAPGFVVPVELPFPPGGLISSGDVFYMQMWYRDGASSNFSDGLTVTFP